MNIDLYEVLAPGMIEGLTAVATVLLPLILWLLIPAAILWIVFKKNLAWNVGAYIGLIGYFTIGPYPLLSF